MLNLPVRHQIRPYWHMPLNCFSLRPKMDHIPEATIAPNIVRRKLAVNAMMSPRFLAYPAEGSPYFKEPPSKNCVIAHAHRMGSRGAWDGSTGLPPVSWTPSLGVS
jgi:hypothetical protein